MEKQEKKREPILMPRLNAVLDYIEKLDFASRQAKERFKDLDSFCLFVGYPRSGHSLVGSLLDAHPEVVMAHELNALRCVKAGFSQNMIFELILRNVQLFNKKGREWTGYNYKVEGQWQGRYRKLKVIGDKKGGNTSLMLKNKAFQTAVERIFKVPVKYLHVIRNPYDNITTMAANSGGDLDFA
ncbi:MAG: hypothetical protein PHX10_08350, partial [Gallionellaceae bacterium]|nr:hypothetical protein [Gallionellaceae bacterium]